MRKIGMSYEGTLREHHKKWGEYEDRVEYGLLARDWRASGVERRRIYPLRG
jgi:ribosomal-protein-alanine N-acetyltransferase